MRHRDGCQAEQEEETKAVGHSCYKDRRCDGRINMNFFKDDRNKVACQRGCEHVQNHCQTGNETEPGVEVVEQSDDGNQSSDHETIDQSGHNLLAEDSKTIFPVNLIQRQGADDNGERLGAGVAAHAAHPADGVNALGILAEVLEKCQNLCENDRTIFGRISALLADCNGASLGVPLTEYLTERLAEKGVNLNCDLTENDFIRAVKELC